jgi:hypothetical protein
MQVKSFKVFTGTPAIFNGFYKAETLALKRRQETIR